MANASPWSWFSIRCRYRRAPLRAASVAPRIVCRAAGMALWLLWSATALGADVPASGAAAEIEQPADAPVVVDGAMLLRVSGISSYPAESRAERIASTIRQLAADPSVAPGSLRVAEEEGLSRILAGDRQVMIVTDSDARREGSHREVVAKANMQRIAMAIEDYRRDRSAASLVRAGALAAAASALLALLLWVGARIMRWLDGVLELRVHNRLAGLERQSLHILSATYLWRVLRAARSFAWTIGVLIAIVVYLHFLLELLPWTRGIGHGLYALVMDPLRAIGLSALDAIPKLLVLALILVATRFALKALRLLFEGLAGGSVKVAAFEAEWSWPTYRLLRLLMVALTVVIAYPYIPGSQSEAFKGVSIFMGVIFSLGSSSLIGNIIAGYSLTYRRAFHIGDRVKIGEHIGEVVEMRLLVTHLRTHKYEEVIIPNSEILGSSVVNYSTFAHAGKLILYTTVGIGYETPWRQVEAMLLQAAHRTDGLLKDPPPFVLQKELGDFAVTYEINGCCNDAMRMNFIYAQLHANILDIFNEYGIQIMTPAYEGDPEQPKIVPREQWYAAPAQPEAGIVNNI